MTENVKYLREVVDAVHRRLKGTVLADFYVRRADVVRGAKRWGEGLFLEVKGGDSPLSGYAFHKGGRRELQFNIGFEDHGYFRYGVAFSLEADRNLQEPLAALSTRMLAFNALLSRFPELADLEMWSYQGERSANAPVHAIPERLFAQRTFIFIGEGVDASDGVTDQMLDRAVSVLVSLFPLYEAIERRVSTERSENVDEVRDSGAAEERTYVARLAYNSRNWQRPVSATEVREAGDTYRSENGFGHEDWLFRDEWRLDGWRYGFVQGVNKSRNRLLREGRTFDLRLFTMPAPGDRRAVAEIREVECLDDQAAKAVVAAYEELGWLDVMRAEVAAAGGRPEALDETGYAPHILNLRYRIENLTMLDADVALPQEDPVHRLTRYELYGMQGALDSAALRWRGRAGKTSLPAPTTYQRHIAGGWATCSPEHIRIQEALRLRLRQDYPGAEVVFEQDFIDVVARTPEEILLFEVKSDLNPLAVVRQALGQVMEYAYHPRRTHDLPLRLVIVGRRDLEGDDRLYFEEIRKRFGLPIEYWSVPV